MKYSLGVDIGSVSAKLALVDETGHPLELVNEKITSGPRAALSALLGRIGGKYDLKDISTAGVSGGGSVAVPDELNWARYSSSLSIAAGLLRSYPDARTIVSIGGQSSLVIGLEDGLKKPWNVASNPLCAAGTGRFIEQQAYRIGISLDDFSRLALSYEGVAPRIAARCSVFAKSDLIHLQQKGVPLAAMLCGLCDSIARMVVSFKKGTLGEPVFFVGGVAANGAVARSLAKEITQRNGHDVRPIVPLDYLYVEAIGSALLSCSSNRVVSLTLPQDEDVKEQHFVTVSLPKELQTNGWQPPLIDKPFTGYLGVDVGSTSTKAVVINESGATVMAKSYLMTAGRPVDAVKDVFRNLLTSLGDKVTIAGAGVTGSGRYLVGSIIGADLVRNEITAQTRAAAEVEPRADIIEIGGQDSKLVIKRNGVVVDYQMNKACAAGTGSFIDELADMLGVSVKNGDFATLAFNAPHTIDLGTRCAAFMGQAVTSVQREGVSTEIIAASLANSIAGNYLSKVVGTRKLGKDIILTGAVFYNDAVVSAFRQTLKDKNIIVPVHKEVSGAIGAALLARESMHGRPSTFKGFQKVAESEHTLSTFTCKACDNNCTITRLVMPGEKPTFYGSRCDKYDGSLQHDHLETSFDERERLLLADHKEDAGKGLTVGIPRALLIYDYLPLLTGFLDSLGVKAVLSSRTNQTIMERAVELSYTDSCFPVKLAHGHVASLREVDYVLFPCFIRMGEKEGDENQKYSCPLVQASPFIIRQALDLDQRLLVPIIDFSRGDGETLNNLTDIALKLGFSVGQGRKAAQDGLARQREFQRTQAEAGQRLLQQIREKNQLGVVILSRSYMSQDPGANLGIAEKLAQLGVVPVPMEYLPLSSIDVKEYSDRPYWMSEIKHVSAAVITANDPQLYGLVLTNFGCGPNSFILNLVEDIMGGKPLGQLEIDEHAAEAGIVTRLEAFVDTIKDFHASRQDKVAGVPAVSVYRSSPTVVPNGKVLIAPRMSPHVDAVVAVMQAYGARAIVLPEPDERNLLYANKVTSGKECLPYRVTLGDFMRFYYDGGYQGLGISQVEGYMAGSFGPCRLGKYALEQRRILQQIGFDLPIRTTVSNNAYSDMGLGKSFERMAWKGIVAVDYLQKLTWHIRPYEKEQGGTDRLFNEYLKRVVDSLKKKILPDALLKQAASEFSEMRDTQKAPKPLVGINGEIFLRSSDFSNAHLIRDCENAGLEVLVSSWAEWVNYIYDRTLYDAIKDRRIKKMITSYIRKGVQKRVEKSVAGIFQGLLDSEEPTTQKLLGISGEYLSARCGSEAVLSIGSGVDWMEHDEFAGVISVMPHGCMPGGIVAAMSEKFSAQNAKPWINLTYDGTAETNNQVRINNFAEIIRYCHRSET
ncbi:MAG: acyl-CoA dehydratase activase [Dehalococcoidia bacterium]|nr:acyl-CoA dehydratase activase [Dehalococcoidia bacterium]